VIAYVSGESELPICFTGQVEGEIVEKARKGSGNSGFGFDPVFKPNGTIKTFAEMDVMEKNKYSHRADVFRRFAKWYRNIS
jgi:XTP/dITP diphosphohydrolase